MLHVLIPILYRVPLVRIGVIGVFFQGHRVLGNVCHLHPGSVRQHPKVFKQSRFDLVHVLAGVLVAHVGRGDVKLEVGAKVFKVVVVRELVGDLHSEGDRGLVRPAPRHVPDGVTATAWKMDSKT